MTRRTTLLMGVALVLYAAIGLAMAWLGDIHTDENWWYYGAVRVAHGEFPHFDFVSHHNPLAYYLYGLAHYCLGDDMMVGRLLSLLLACVTFGITMRLAHKKGGAVALAITALLFLVNLYSTYRYTLIHYQALQTLLLTGLCAVLFSEWRQHTKVAVGMGLAMLLVATRYLTDYFLILMAGYLLYTLWHARRDPRQAAIAWVVALVGGVALLAPHLRMVPDRYWFNAIWYLLNMDAFKAEFGLGAYSRMDALMLRAAWVREWANNFFPVLLLGGMAGVTAIGRSWRVRRLLIDRRYAWLTGFVIITEMFYIIPHSSELAHQSNFIFPLMVVLASVGFVRVWPTMAGWQRAAVVGPVMVLAVCLQIPVGEQNFFAWHPARSDLHNVRQVAERIAALTPPDGSIFTFTPVFVAQARRQVMPGMEMEYATFFPTWDTARARRYGLINVDMLRAMIAAREPAALVLSEKRFFEDGGYALIMRPYRKDLLDLIDQHYRLAETVDAPHSVFRGNVRIYLPKPM